MMGNVSLLVCIKDLIPGNGLWASNCSDEGSPPSFFSAFQIRCGKYENMVHNICFPGLYLRVFHFCKIFFDVMCMS